jgi:site-specific recombinase XerD
LDHLRLSGASAYTLESWGHAVQRCHDQLPHGLDAAEPAELLRWLANPRWAKKTRASYRSALRSFYRWACDPDDPWLATDPAAGLPRIRVSRGVPRCPTDAQVGVILCQAVEPYRLWATLAAMGGLRCIEVARLTRQDIAEAVIYIAGKGDKARAVPTHPDVWAAVADQPPGHLVPRQLADTRLAPDEADKRVARRVSRSAGRHFRQVLAVPVPMHHLRHWHLTRALEACKDPRVVQELAGHASLETTMVYTAVAPGRMREAVMALPRLSAGATSGADPAPTGR